MLGNVEALVQMYDLVKGQIAAIDEELDAAQGGKAAGKRAIINTLVKENGETIDIVLGQLREQLFDSDKFSDQQKAAFYYGLLSTLRDNFETRAQETIDPMVKEVPDAPAIPAEELQKKSNERSLAYKQAKYVRELLSMFGEDLDNYPMPKRRGGGGKRGTRELSKYSWSLDGERMPADSDSLTAIAKKLGFEKSVTLRELMRNAGINLTNPVDPITFDLSAEDSPDNESHSIVGNKRAEEEEDEEDDEDSEDSDSE